MSSFQLALLSMDWLCSIIINIHAQAVYYHQPGLLAVSALIIPLAMLVLVRMPRCIILLALRSLLAGTGIDDGGLEVELDLTSATASGF